MVVALIDLEASDSSLPYRGGLSQNISNTMAPICEGALGVSDVGFDGRDTGGERVVRSRCSKRFLLESLTSLDQLATPVTALTTRTSDAVIADLKAGRGKRRPTLTSLKAESSEQAAPDASSVAVAGQHGGNNEESEENDSEPEEVFLSSKPRKLSERKRIQNAAMDNWIYNYQKQQAKAASTAKDLGSESYSVKYLIRQSESQKIISTPREYQLELFERAKEENIIAVLDTGSGKTLIAVLLLQHIIRQEHEDRARGNPKRVAFFLVDSVQLIFQQYAVLECNLDQPMDRFCGAMGADLLDKRLWEKACEENMVIVCTAEVLRNALHHSFISIHRINLLIFDEAHHAKKDHPYARIIKDFYAQEIDMSKRPKIFGMTASPVDTRLNVIDAAAELEIVLHCKITTASDLTLLQYAVNSKVEEVDSYEPLEAPFETPLYKKMRDKLEDNGVFSKLLRYAKEASSELGTWCADHLWSISLTEEEMLRLEAKTQRKFATQDGDKPLDAFEAQILQLKEARKIVEAHSFEEPLPFLDHLSTKVMSLLRYLRERFTRTTEDKCIVFVKQRYTARILFELFSRPKIGTPNLHVGTLVGGSHGDVADSRTSFRQQVITLMKFRKGVLNCLFATSVAEEGLDIPDCNLVIRFDLYSTVIQYIQSRGRARLPNSRYIHMIEKGNRQHKALLLDVQRSESILRKFCSGLHPSRKVDSGDLDMDYFLAKERTHRVYIEPTTGAKLTYKMSLTVLANFVSSLPKNSETSLAPEYFTTGQNGQFICEVILPDKSPVSSAIGRPASTKQVAKCSAAFEACLLLKKKKVLDANLLSTYQKQAPIMRNAHLAVSSKAQDSYEMRNKPELWSVDSIPTILYLTVFTLTNPDCLLRPSQPLGLLTRSNLPQFPEIPLFFGRGNNSLVLSHSQPNGLEVDSSTLGMINEFTLRIFKDVFSKEYETDLARMPYFLVPIKPSTSINKDSFPVDLIDWQSLEEIQLTPELIFDDQADEKDFKNRYIVDPFDGSRKLWTRQIAPQYRPMDPVPPNTAPRKGPRKNNATIMEYSCSLWANSRARRNFRENQPVIEAEYIPLRRNLLEDGDIVASDGPKQCFIILEPLRVSALPTTVVAMAYLFPSIIYRVESYLIALEACRMLHLDIRPDLALEAMTKDSDNSEEHGEEPVHFQRGMGNNYERLEFLGDCFLKMATSISLYSGNANDDQFDFHVKRMQMVCNKNLLNVARELKLYKYIRSQGFNRRAWYPEGLVLKKGKTAATAPKSHRLADKTIADVSEALIGAALLTCHELKNFDGAVRAVTELVCSTDHVMKSWKEYYQSYEKPKYQLAPSTASQRVLAQQMQQKHPYTFKHPRLLRSAFRHKSHPFSYEHVPHYERLEFLGDSLLDMACINYLFHRFPNRDPQWLTEHKMAMVSNQFLGALCVSLGFHKHLLLFDSQIRRQIADYVYEITVAQLEAEEEAVKAGKSQKDRSPDFWVHTILPPKCLPDIVEAYVGAIFIDSDFNYSEIEHFFDRNIQPYFENMGLYDTYANKHPVTFLSNFLTQNMGCCYWSYHPRQLPDLGDGAQPQVVVAVMIHNQVIVDSEGTSGRYAKISAAKKALELLQGLPLLDFKQTYNCDCKVLEAQDEEYEDGESSEEKSEQVRGEDELIKGS